MGVGKPRKFNTRKFFYNENLLRLTQSHTHNLRMCIRCPAALVPMALLRFLQPTTGLPDPRGALSSSVLSQAIAEANRQVQEATSCSKKKRGPYNTCRFSAGSSLMAASHSSW